MICKNCGKENNNEAKFCTSCGAPLILENNNNTQLNMNQGSVDLNNNNTQLNMNQGSVDLNNNNTQLNMSQEKINLNNNNNNVKNNELKKNNKKILLIVLIIIILIICIIVKNTKTKENEVSGMWNCYEMYGSDQEYDITFVLNNDNTFKWYQYNNEKANHVYGTYTYEYNNKVSQDGTHSYYIVKIDGTEFVNDGELQNDKYASTYEMGVNINKKDAVMMNLSTYRIYQCYQD